MMDLVVHSSCERLQRWLDSVPDDKQRTVREHLRDCLDRQPYFFANNDSNDREQLTGWDGVAYWLQLLNNHLCHLKSKTLKTTFRCVETAPLLCILLDCLHHVDDFFMKCETDEMEGERNGESLFLQGLEMYCLLQQRLRDMTYSWAAVVKCATPDLFRGFVEAHRSKVISTQESIVESCRVSMHACYPAASKPRYIQLCDKLQLSGKEREALHYIFMQNAGVLFATLHKALVSHGSGASPVGGSQSTSMALAAASFAGMNGKEMYEFFSEDRPLLNQELITPEDEFSSLITASFLKMPQVVLKACCGCQLSADELYKVDKTVLAEILSAEMSSGDVSAKKETESLAAPELVTHEVQEEDEGEEQLEELLEASNDTKGQPQPYTTDLEYLEDNFELIEVLVKARKTETSDDMLLLRSDQRKPEAIMREMKAKARSLRAKVVQRMEVTKKVDGWLPRLERLAELKKLDEFEKSVLLTLTGCMVSRNLRDSGHGDSVFRHHTNIGMLVGLFCEGLEEQIKARVYFYRNSQLVKEGLIHVSDPPLLSRGNFLDAGVELDRRLLDYIVGLDTEMNELVDGSDLYSPDTMLSDVALPANLLQLLLNTFDSFYKFQKTCQDLQLSTRGYSKGLCLLFYGPSGTGKTMTANAVANFLGKKVLLVTVSVMTERELTKELLRFLFREAKIHNALIFFDECEPLFESRENRPNTSLALMLTEIEQNDGIIILATNRHQDLDEAMHRRIQLALPFSVPDHTLRADIWKSHVPNQLLEGEVDWTNLAQSYELTGGLIRNAVLSAVSLSSMKSDDDKVTLTQADLHAGAKLQLRGLLEMVDFERRVIPTFGLEEVVMDKETQEQLSTILHTAKTHKFISSQWGFASGKGNVASAGGVIVLLSAPARSGKTTVGLALAYELGQPVKEANCSELLSHTVSSNPRASKGIATFFKDAHQANAVVMLDSAEFILGSVSTGLLSGIVGCETYSLAYQVERYPGLVILNTRQDIGLLDLSRLPQLRYIMSLRMPSVQLRERLWKKLLPEKAPLASQIDFAELAQRFTLTGGQIATAICSAAEQVASSSSELVITTQLLCSAAEEQLRIASANRTQAMNMFQ